jgi:hypothetical protein
MNHIITSYDIASKRKERVKNILTGSKYSKVHWWLTSVILAAQGAEIRGLSVQSQPKANSSTRSCFKKPIT